MKSYQFIATQLSYKIKTMSLKWVGLPHWKEHSKSSRLGTIRKMDIFEFSHNLNLSHNIPDNLLDLHHTTTK
jgi:hypothetical protein